MKAKISVFNLLVVLLAVIAIMGILQPKVNRTMAMVQAQAYRPLSIVRIQDWEGSYMRVFLLRNNLGTETMTCLLRAGGGKNNTFCQPPQPVPSDGTDKR
jgi:hypothetical protein